MPRPVIVLTPDPLTVVIPAWCVFLGIVGGIFYGFVTPASAVGIPRTGVYVFFAGMVVCGSALLYGMWLRNVRGMRIKLGANVALGSLLLIYSGWAVQAMGFMRPLNIVSVFVAISVASFWQARRLNKALNPKE